MAHDDDPPELRGYVPRGERPLRHPLTLKVMRVVIVLGVVGLVIPGLYATVTLQGRTAEAMCARAVSQIPGAVPVARFEIVGPAGPSWYCYAVGFGGDEALVGELGLIPG